MKIGDLEKVRTLSRDRADWVSRLRHVRARLPMRLSVYVWDGQSGGMPVIPQWACTRADEHPALRAYFEAMIIDRLAAIDRELVELGVEVGP